MPMGMKSPSPMRIFGRGRSYGELNSRRGSGELPGCAATRPSFVLKEGKSAEAGGPRQLLVLLKLSQGHFHLSPPRSHGCTGEGWHRQS